MKLARLCQILRILQPMFYFFYLTHVNRDRLLSIWQNQNPTPTGTDTIMDPWSFNEQDTRDTTFGYVCA